MVPFPVLASLAVSAVLSAAFPIAVFFICRKRMTLLMPNILIGAAVFFLFAGILEKALHFYVLKANPVTATWLPLHPAAYALYGSLAAGLFEEAGRYFGMRYFVRNSGNPGTAVAYGIGHGGIEAILIGSLPAAGSFVFAVLLNSGLLQSAVGSGSSADNLAQVKANLQGLSVATVAMGTLERLIALLIQIGLSLIVWRAVETKRLRLLGLAIFLHALIDFPAGLFQKGQLPLAGVEGLLTIVGAGLVAFFLLKLPRKFTAMPAQRS
jgi:uncharacterized membrane protein YhfC